MDKLYYMGIDVGSTTVKLYVEDQEHQCIYQNIKDTILMFNSNRKSIKEVQNTRETYQLK